jgi:hypothetical protein
MSNKTLAEYVAIEPTRATVVADCVALVDEEVRSKGGLSGVTIKAAYGTVKTIKPRFVEGVIDASLGEFLTARSDEVAEDLLAVTDDRARSTKHKTAAKLYDKMRPSAKKNVAAAMPKLGGLMEKHVGAA